MTTDTDTTSGGSLPPPPRRADLPPPTLPPSATPSAPRATPPGRPWRDRLPEVVGAIGTLLVVAAGFGFLSATWEQLDELGRGLVLAGAATGLTFVVLQLEGRERRTGTLLDLLWGAATSLTGSAALLLVAGVLAAPSRIVALLAGLAAAGHAAAALRRSPQAPVRQLGLVGGLLLAAGAFGTSLDDRLDAGWLVEAVAPLAGLFDPTWTSDAYLVTGPAHLAIGLGWLLLGRRLTGAAARLAEVGGTVLLGYAALQLLVLTSPLGAFAALLLTLALLVHGLVTERASRILSGAVLVLVCAGRVLWALFSGQVAVTVAALVVGLGLLAWAVRARRDADGAAARPADA